jgi:hypothetical protein
MSKPLVRIENWAVVQKSIALNFEELQPGKHLIGTVVGHRTLPNAECVYTSPILSVDVDERRVETRNTVYQLGEPSETYKSWEHDRKFDSAA